jgi:hypothetical protein
MSATSLARRNQRRGFVPPKMLPVPPTSQQPQAPLRIAKKVLFASAHSIVDFSNGASIATLEGLTTAGFNCQAFCAGKLDFQTEARLDEIADAMHAPHRDEPSVCGSQLANVMYTRRQHVPVTLIRLESTRQQGYYGSENAEKQPSVIEGFGWDEQVRTANRRLPRVQVHCFLIWPYPWYRWNPWLNLFSSGVARLGRHRREFVRRSERLDCPPVR